MKPNDEYGGTGVTLGWECTDGAAGTRRWIARWAPRAARWVVQRKIHVRRELFPKFERRAGRDDAATCSSTARRTSSAASWQVS